MTQQMTLEMMMWNKTQVISPARYLPRGTACVSKKKVRKGCFSALISAHTHASVEWKLVFSHPVVTLSPGFALPLDLLVSRRPAGQSAHHC